MALGASGAYAMPASSSTMQSAVRIDVLAIRVTGVSPHPEQNLSAESVQALANQELRRIAGDQDTASVTFTQLHQIADTLTAAYRKAGFLVARAYIPQQKIGPDKTVEIRVAEGRIGKITVEGNHRYNRRLLSGAATALQGQVLRQQDLQSALLRIDDLPGVTATTVLKPGTTEGETDIVLQAHEDKPLQFSLGASNYGNETIGRYTGQLGIDWNNPLGLGDHLGVNAAYALDPTSSWQGAIDYAIPIIAVDGLSVSAGYTRSRISLDSGVFAALHLQGPSQQAELGLDWVFADTPSWRAQGWLHFVHESSRIEGLDTLLSKQEFDVAEAGLNVRQVSMAQHAIDALQLSVRQSLQDNSSPADYLYPEHSRKFTIERLGFSRLQGLTDTQRLQLRLDGQYTNDALTPLEQFSLGGPANVRAAGLNQALGDRGFDGGVEYQVDAPRAPAPLGGGSWSDLLTFKVFYDYGRTYANGANRAVYTGITTLQGPGAGLSFHAFHGLSVDLSVAKPIGQTRAVDDKSVQYWARVGFTF